MKNFRWLLLGVSLLLLAPLVAETASSLQPKPVATVFDSTGKFVGNVIDTNFSLSGQATGLPTVAFTNGSETVFVGVTPNFFVGNTIQRLFATADCTGTAYFFTPSLVLPFLNTTQPMPSVISDSLVADDGTLYAAPGNPSAPLTVTINSISSRFSGFPGPDVCIPAPFGAQSVVEAKPVTNLTALFTPPYVLH